VVWFTPVIRPVSLIKVPENWRFLKNKSDWMNLKIFVMRVTISYQQQMEELKTKQPD
jgi:hypothetical protein